MHKLFPYIVQRFIKDFSILDSLSTNGNGANGNANFGSSRQLAAMKGKCPDSTFINRSASEIIKILLISNFSL